MTAVAALGLAPGYQALRQTAGACLWPRDVVRVSGPDAAAYLQGQTSQDLASLGPGAQAWALVLQPQGKLDAFVRAYRAGPEEFLLDTDPGMADALVARLLRFRLRTKVEVEARPGLAFLAVRGPAVPAPADLPTANPPTADLPTADLPTADLPTANPPTAGPPTAGPPTAGLAVVGFSWGGLTGYDLAPYGPGPVPGPTEEGPGPALAAQAGLALVPNEALEVALIEAGFPRHGYELDERTIPAEAGLVPATVSFTKGCYTGQELVARIDSRGNNVPRRLWGLTGAEPFVPGERLVVDDGGRPGEAEVGRVTRAARSPRLGPVALAYLGRRVEAGATVWASSGPASVHALPL